MGPGLDLSLHDGINDDIGLASDIFVCFAGSSTSCLAAAAGPSTSCSRQLVTAGSRAARRLAGAGPWSTVDRALPPPSGRARASPVLGGL